VSNERDDAGSGPDERSTKPSDAEGEGHEGAKQTASGAEGEGQGPAVAEVDLEALAAEDGDAEPDEAALDMSELDAVGVDGVVARLRRPNAPTDAGEEAAEDAAVLRKPRRHRSPFVSVLVVGFGAYLLITMLADFRYWLRASEPVELGHASSLLQDGRTLDPYEDQYVALEGTPDVQHATRLTTKERFVGYLRVTEGEGGLFAAVPRPKDQEVTNNFEGRYVGRLRRLRDDRAFEWLADFYATERVTTSVDLDPKGMVAALGSDRLPTAEGGSVEVGTRDELWLTVEGPDARVQLGRSSFADAAAAERAVAALGHPYVQLDPTPTFFRFVVRLPAGERAAAQKTLNAGVPGAEDSSDPKVGAFVLGLSASYGATTGDVAVAGDALVLPYGNNTTSPGYDVKDGRLVERAPSEQLRLPLDQLSSARLDRAIAVDPDGFVVAVGEDPSSQLQAGILWLLVLAITAANTASLVLWWRRRTV
jgi:hypothetical protein